MILKLAVVTAAVALCAIVGQNDTQTPFFCNLNALTAAERSEHLLLTKRLLESVLKKIETPDGYAFEVDGARVSLKDLATWTDFERRCCPFFDVTLELRRENGPLTLR